ncbi:MAG: AAA family ATPase [Candidatus Tectomicrobia bacterium]|nr:AAA family ATPase [Candidatus Tectomicrobia bacterium]
MYESFFGLKEKPFNVTPDPKYLFLSKNHEEALAHLLYGIKERKGFIEITGEVGTGKTLLCRTLLNELGDDVATALILNSYLSEVDLLKNICDDFGIATKAETKKGLIDKINKFLIDLLSNGKNAVLIIDEAQNLDQPVLEQIRMLSNLETEREKLIQIVLVGQPELKAILDLPSMRQLNQRIAVRHHLLGLTQEETKDYIAHRLSVAGSMGNLKFARQAIQKIYRYSQGIPRKINIICDRALLAAYVLETKRVTGKIAEQAAKEIEGTFLSRDWETLRLGKGNRSLKRRRGVFATSLILSLLLGVLAFRHADELSHYYGELFRKLFLSTTQVQGATPQAQGTTVGNRLPPSPPPVLEKPLMSDPPPLPQAIQEPVVSSPSPPLQTIQDEPPQVPVTEPLEATQASLQKEPLSLGEPPKHLEALMAIKYQLGNLKIIKGGSLSGNEIKVFATQQKMESIAPRLTINHLEKLRIPSLLELSSESSASPQYLVFLRLEGEKVIFYDEGGEGFYRREALLRDWDGKAYLFSPSAKNLYGRLTEGSSGPEVMKLQGQLQLLGYFDEAPYGEFDRKTKRAVMQFQREYGLEIDGVVGKETKIMLYSVIGE